MTESELRYRTLIEQLPIVTYIDALDDRSSNIYTSPQLEPLLGYAVEEWQADEELFVRILHPDDRERVLSQIQESNASGEPFESEYRLIARDGRVVWFRDECVVVRDESGAPLYSQGYLLDITDRKTAERVLEAVAEIAGELVATPAWEDVDVVDRLRAAVRTSRAYLVQDVRREGGRGAGQLLAESTDGTVGSMAGTVAGGRFEYDSDGFGPFRAALARGEIVRRIAGDFPASEQQEWEREGVRSTLVVPIQVGEAYWGHIGFQDCTEKRVWTDAEADALRAGAGILGAAIHRQATRDALAESEARFAAFMDTTPAVAFAKDSDGRYVYANARWLELFGHRLDELLGHTDAELFPGSAEDFRAHDAAALAAGGSVSNVDRVEAGGTARTLMTLKFPFLDSSGEEFVGGVALDITEREQAEQELRATTRLLESIVDSSPLAIVTFDREGRVMRWNEAATRMFGWSAEEVLGQFNPLLPESERDGFLEMLSLTLEGRFWRDVEVLRRRKEGTLIDVSVSSAPLRAASGEVTGMVAMLDDVTERTRAERRLAAQHAVARALAESTTLDEAAPRILEEVCGALGWEIGGLWTVDPALGRLRLASIWASGDRRFQRFVDESWSLELGPGEGFPGAVWETGETGWFSDVAGSSRSRAAAVASAGLHGALAAPAVSGGEVLGVLELFSTRVWVPDDELVAMLTSVGSQIGQFLRRTQADREVREREERFRTLVANLPGAIYRCAADEDWTMSFMSGVIRAITGYPASDFVDNAGRSFASVILPDDRAMVSQVVGSAVRRKEPFELEYRIAHADGSVRWVAEKGQPIIGPGGEVLWLDGAIFDVTEQRALELLKDEFVALVSHELRTPLTSILGYLELVLEGEAGEISDDQARFLAIIERNARRLLRLVGDLLFVAQIEAGQLVIEREPCDLAQLAADCIEAARPRASEQEVDLALESDTRVELLGDRTRLAQLLDNLVSNAIKFTPEGGLVRVQVTRHGRRVVVGVSDTGMGIPPDEQASLFQRFFRSAEATRRAIPGTGLGLTITKAIVDAHGGSIDVESELGAGTTFAVVLPVEPTGEDGV